MDVFENRKSCEGRAEQKKKMDPTVLKKQGLIGLINGGGPARAAMFNF